MKRFPKAYRFLAALVCACVLLSSFGGLTTARAYDPNANNSVSPLDTSVRPYPSGGPAAGGTFQGVTVDQVTLLTGIDSDLIRPTIGETIAAYKETYVLGVAADFCVFLEDYFTTMESDTEGRLAVGGDINVNTPFGWVSDSQRGEWNYTVGAGDFNTHVPLDVLLGNRTGAATVIVGGKLGTTATSGNFNGKTFTSATGQLNDTYYDLKDGKYEKFETHDNNLPEKMSTKRIVINQDPARFDRSSYLDGNIPEQNWNPDYWKVLQAQAYVTEILDFEDAFRYLDTLGVRLKAQADLTQNADDTSVTFDGNTITFTYEGVETVQECIYFDLTKEQFQQYFQQARYINFVNVPSLPEARDVVNNNGVMDKWYYSYIIINVAGDGEFRFNPFNNPQDSKITTIYPAAGGSINISNDGNPEDNNHKGVTSILYNFYEAQENSEIILCSNFQGTILAPHSHITDEFAIKIKEYMATHGVSMIEAIDINKEAFKYYRGHLSGALIAKSFEGGTEFGYRPFSGMTGAIFGSGNLAITKTVEGDGADADQTFTFTVKLTAEDDYDELLTSTRTYPVTVSLASDATDTALEGTIDRVTFVNGVATITIKDGQKVTIRDLPAGYTYTITETDLPIGYVSGVIGESDTGTIVAGSTQTAGFRNTYHTGSLKLEKTLTGDTPDPAPVFTFTVTLIDPATNKTCTSINGTFDGVTFTNGVATVTLAAGTSKTITGLPFGLKYRVTEATLDGYEQTSVTGNEGTIPQDGIVTASFTNARLTGALKLEKTLTGEIPDPAPVFSFTVTLINPETDETDTSVNGTYDGVTFTGGVATVEVAAGESKTITGLPAGLKYTVVEAHLDGYEQDGVTGDEGTIPAKGNVTASFVNAEVIEKFGSLTITKQVTGETDDDTLTFDFTVTVMKDGEGISGTYDGVTFTNGVATVTVKAGESRTIAGLPADATYTVVEQTKEGYKQVSATEDEGTIPADGSAEAVFVNAKTEDEEEDKFGSLTITKQVTGATADDTLTFDFTVTVMKDGTGISGTYDGVTFTNGVATVTVKAGESKTITGLPADATYTVVEQTKEGYKQVGATGDKGTIPADGSAEAVFVNAKTEDEEEEKFGSLTITKQVTGATATADNTLAFTFTVTVVKDGEGISGTYDGVTFTNGVATVTVKAGESKTITGLPADATYTVVEQTRVGYKQVSATGDKGTIPADGKAEAVFINTKSTTTEDDDGGEEEALGNLTVTKQVSGTAGDKSKTFSFTVLLSDTGINGVYGDMTFTNGVATFTLKHGESKTASGLPEGLRYSVSEAAANQDGYTTTSVGDRGTIPGADTATAIFINAKDDAASDMPQTGDNSQLGLWVGLMLAAMTMMVACVLTGRKQGHNRR